MMKRIAFIILMILIGNGIARADDSHCLRYILADILEKGVTNDMLDDVHHIHNGIVGIPPVPAIVAGPLNAPFEPYAFSKLNKLLEDDSSKVYALDYPDDNFGDFSSCLDMNEHYSRTDPHDSQHLVLLISEYAEAYRTRAVLEYYFLMNKLRLAEIGTLESMRAIDIALDNLKAGQGSSNGALPTTNFFLDLTHKGWSNKLLQCGSDAEGSLSLNLSDAVFGAFHTIDWAQSRIKLISRESLYKYQQDDTINKMATGGRVSDDIVEELRAWRKLQQQNAEMVSSLEIPELKSLTPTIYGEWGKVNAPPGGWEYTGMPAFTDILEKVRAHLLSLRTAANARFKLIEEHAKCIQGTENLKQKCYTDAVRWIATNTPSIRTIRHDHKIAYAFSSGEVDLSKVDDSTYKPSNDQLLLDHLMLTEEARFHARHADIINQDINDLVVDSVVTVAMSAIGGYGMFAKLLAASKYASVRSAAVLMAYLGDYGVMPFMKGFGAWTLFNTVVLEHQIPFIEPCLDAFKNSGSDLSSTPHILPRNTVSCSNGKLPMLIKFDKDISIAQCILAMEQLYVTARGFTEKQSEASMVEAVKNVMAGKKPAVNVPRTSETLGLIDEGPRAPSRLRKFFNLTSIKKVFGCDTFASWLGIGKTPPNQGAILRGQFGNILVRMREGLRALSKGSDEVGLLLEETAKEVTNPDVVKGVRFVGKKVKVRRVTDQPTIIPLPEKMPTDLEMRTWIRQIAGYDADGNKLGARVAQFDLVEAVVTLPSEVLFVDMVEFAKEKARIGKLADPVKFSVNMYEHPFTQTFSKAWILANVEEYGHMTEAITHSEKGGQYLSTFYRTLDQAGLSVPGSDVVLKLEGDVFAFLVEKAGPENVPKVVQLHYESVRTDALKFGITITDAEVDVDTSGGSGSGGGSSHKVQNFSIRSMMMGVKEAIFGVPARPSVLY